jgi:hypothetical protein
MKQQAEPIQIIKLKHPFTIGESEEAVTEVRIMRRLKGKDLKGMKESPSVADMYSIMSKITGMEVYYFEEMDVEDVFACMEILTGFLGNIPKIGLQNSAQ